MTAYMEEIIACFFPTRTVFIDDKREFLDGLVLNLNTKNQKYDFFDSPVLALDEIGRDTDNGEWHKNCIASVEEEVMDRKLLEMNIPALHRRLLNASRFNTITTVVVDYDMPEINGLTLCEEIKNKGIFKVLLTGAADDKIAVEAFNNRLIDAFIPKYDFNIYTSLQSYIDRGAFRYFQNISKPFFLALGMEKDSDFVKDPNFLAFFQKFLQEHDVVEFYLVESTGSYVLKSRLGTLSVLWIAPEHYLDQMYVQAEDEGYPRESLDKLRSKEMMLCNSEALFGGYQGSTGQTYINQANCFCINDKQYYYAHQVLNLNFA